MTKADLPQWRMKPIPSEAHERLAERGINFEDSCDAMVYEIKRGTPRGNEIMNRILNDMLAAKKRQRDWLSSAEVTVLRLVAEGKRADAIACALERSVETVKTHISNAKHILGADSTSHAVAIAMRQGYIS